MEHKTVALAWSNIPFSASLPDKVNMAWADTLSAVGSPSTISSGADIIELDDKDTTKGFLVVSGSFSILKGDAYPIIKDVPELLGEMSRFNPNHTRTAQVRAETDVSVISFDWDEVFDRLNVYLTEDELSALNHAFEQYAWEHFTDV